MFPSLMGLVGTPYHKTVSGRPMHPFSSKIICCTRGSTIKIPCDVEQRGNRNTNSPEKMHLMDLFCPTNMTSAAGVDHNKRGDSTVGTSAINVVIMTTHYLLQRKSQCNRQNWSSTQYYYHLTILEVVNLLSRTAQAKLLTGVITQHNGSTHYGLIKSIKTIQISTNWRICVLGTALSWTRYSILTRLKFVKEQKLSLWLRVLRTLKNKLRKKRDNVIKKTLMTWQWHVIIEGTLMKWQGMTRTMQ